MVSSFIFIILLAIIYGLATEETQFTATASAIRQIWSGRCRLACQESEYSDYSGISSLLQGPRVNIVSNHAGPSSGCICEACPCALVDNILRTCSPVTQLYSDIIETLSNFFYEIMKTITEACTCIQSVFECRASCRQNDQVHMTGQATSSIAPNIEEKEFKENPKVREIKSEASSAVSKSSEIPTKVSAPIIEGPSKNKNKKKIEEPSKSRESRESSKSAINLDKKSCSKCRLKGNVCMPDCPKAKK